MPGIDSVANFSTVSCFYFGSCGHRKNATQILPYMEHHVEIISGNTVTMNTVLLTQPCVFVPPGTRLGVGGYGTQVTSSV